jgi:hypothetical protein
VTTNRLLLILGALAVLAALLPASVDRAHADANPCGIPGYSTLWIDYADSSVPFRLDVFARPGVIGAVSSQSASQAMRDRGGLSVYWDMYLNNRVGTPSAPADPATIQAKANKLFDYAAAATGCATPWIAENELFGAGLTTPWSQTNATYRQNVLVYLQTLASRGARPFLLVNSTPYTDGTAGDWWRQVAQVSDIVREVYFPAPAVWKQGPLLGSRFMRVAFRNGITDFTSIGIPATRLGLTLGFQTQTGTGGREGLELGHWLQTIKWQALAARQAAADLHFATVWSWGWGTFGTSGVDPDKPAAACVYLWTRSPELCDGPKWAGTGFDASLTAGQIRLPSGIVCSIGGSQIASGELGPLVQLTGDRDLAFTVLLERVAERSVVPVSTAQILAAEQTVIATRFGGSTAAYRSALAAAHATVPLARQVLADQLRRARIEATLPRTVPSESEIETFYLGYPDLLVRPVEAVPAAPWLGGKTKGYALSELAPDALFGLRTDGSSTVRTLNASFKVHALGGAVPLGSLPLAQVRPAIRSALQAFAQGAAFESWTAARQTSALNAATCLGDNLPAPGSVDLSLFLPFLGPTALGG